MNIKRSLVSTIASLTMAAGLNAAEVSVSGSVASDVVGSVNSDESMIEWSNNHELDLTIGAKFSEKVTVETYLTMLAGTMPGGGGDIYERWGPAWFDGLTLMYTPNDKLSFSVGDLVFADGPVSYYLYKTGGVIMPETFTRGVQMDAMGVTLAFGSADVKAEITDEAGEVVDEVASVMDIYAAYSLGTDKFSVKVPLLVRTSSEATDIKTGVAGSAAFGDHSVSASFGYILDDDKDASMNFIVEPSLAFGNVSLAASFYMALLGDDPSALAMFDDEMFVYVEPGVSLSETIAVGLPIEYHALVLDEAEGTESDDNYGVYPTLYVTPAENVSWLVYGGVTMYAAEGADPGIAFGTEIGASF